MFELSHSLIFYNFQFLNIEREEKKSPKRFERKMLEKSHKWVHFLKRKLMKVVFSYNHTRKM